MDFEWDERKALANKRKHGVHFQEAATVFGDRFAVTFFDPDHSIMESRFLTFGFSAQKRLLVVAHTDRDDVTRIINARPMSRKEREIYEEA
ncbi:MAG: BrnT family toxin [Nitrospinae bacterium]|nr:BrnT family toxin [Nitrospinota bacterium]